MKITFLGSGSAFVLGHQNYQSNILFTKNDKHLLYDAGTTIAEALHSQKLKPQDLDFIYISHLHSDHCGGIEYLAFKTYFEQFPFGIKKINLLGHYSVLINGWRNSWRGGLEHINGKINTLSDYFNCFYLYTDDSFLFEKVLFKPIQTPHVKSEEEIPSFGMICKDDDVSIYISGDSTVTDELDKYDLIFHDCEFKEYPNSVHAQFLELCELPADIKRKMWLYHHDLFDESLEDANSLVFAEGFAGIVRRGQVFDTKNYKA